jgi:hypothetical protein
MLQINNVLMTLSSDGSSHLGSRYTPALDSLMQAKMNKIFNQFIYAYILIIISNDRP